MRLIIIFTVMCVISSTANAMIMGTAPLNKKEQLNEQILEQAKDLEAVLISTMIEPMFPEGKESGIYGGGHGSGIYRQMMIDEYGKTMSRSGGLGLAKSITKDLIRRRGE